ncbi:MAG: ATP-dependent Clp protease ATP-binding subunit [Catenulispora sp.]|nr:ATP-dependent Clp protease ATP-binding subunit [Catenulispora sp.]
MSENAAQPAPDSSPSTPSISPAPPNPPTLPALISAIASRHPATDPIARLTEAVQTAATLTTLADHLIGHFVDAARAAGASWTQIGVGLGVSKQAVQQRFVPREPTTVADFTLDRQRFTSFTSRCVDCVAAAEKVAQGTGAAAVTPTHILIGLFAEPESIAVRALAEHGPEIPDRIRAAAVDSLPAPDPEHSAAGADAGFPFAPDSRKIFDLAVRAGLTLGHNYIGTEHLLLALAADPESATARLLAAEPFHLTHDVLAASIENQLAELRRRRAEQQAKFPPVTGAVSPLGPADQGAGSGAG